MFDREELSLDPDSIRELSTHLTDLSRREMGDDPAQWRATAQFLALATRLQPANRYARDLAKMYSRGEAARQNGSDPNQALLRAWRIVSWLRRPEAGEEGQKLAALVMDPLRVVDPEHPHSKAHDASGEHARWQGIVPALARFQLRSRPSPTPELPNPEIPTPEPEIPRAPIVLRTGSLQTVLYGESNGAIAPQVTTVAMKVTTTGTKDPFEVVLEGNQPLPPSLKYLLLQSLQSKWSALPLGERATLSLGTSSYPAANREALSGPALLLLHSAFNGTELRSDLVVMGRISSDGRLLGPRAAWQLLQSLRGHATGGTLCVPKAMLPEVRSLLALEIPKFFLTWEVHSADSLSDLQSLLTDALKVREVVAARPHYRELRSLGAETNVGQLCVKTDVRNKLAAILNLVPHHASARMLQLQGSALERPTRIEQAATARLLDHALYTLQPLVETPLAELNAAGVAPLVKSTQGEVDRFKDTFHPEDTKLHEQAGEVLQSATTLGLALREASIDGTGERSYQNEPVSFYQETLKANLHEFRRSIFRFTNGLPQPLPQEVETNPTPR